MEEEEEEEEEETRAGQSAYHPLLSGVACLKKDYRMYVCLCRHNLNLATPTLLSRNVNVAALFGLWFPPPCFCQRLTVGMHTYH